jgi:rSAM/selenodomain-associated transferase 2
LTKISIVIPALNEEEAVGALVRSFSTRDNLEVIVADGGSSDATVSVARSEGAVTLAPGRGRALQMNAGAARARGETILFLHADTSLPEDFDSLVTTVMEVEDTAGGAFSFSTDGKGPFFRFITRTANFRSRRLGIVFGDQAIFARSGLFRETGGFPDQPIMEDYEFVRRLRERGRFVILPEAAETSSRRWERIGPWRNTLLNVVITWGYRAGIAPERLKAWHRRWGEASTRPR